MVVGTVSMEESPEASRARYGNLDHRPAAPAPLLRYALGVIPVIRRNVVVK